LFTTDNQSIYLKPSLSRLNEIVSSFVKNTVSEQLLILTTEPLKAFKAFAADYTLIEAAGGIIRNQKGEILFIYRNKKWDLPKGKREEGESIRKTALREVNEETGLNDLIIKDKLPSTLHIYSEKNQKILKKTHWYEMLSVNPEALKPQTEEGISKVKWVPLNEIDPYLKKTYRSLNSLLSYYVIRNRA